MFAGFALLHVSARLSASSFTVHWSTVIGIAGLAVLYERGARLRGISRPSPAQRFSYYAALVVMRFAVSGRRLRLRLMAAAMLTMAGVALIGVLLCLFIERAAV